MTSPFHGADAGSNPAGDAKSVTYRRNVYSLFNKRIENSGLVSEFRVIAGNQTRIAREEWQMSKLISYTSGCACNEQVSGLNLSL